MKPIMSIKNLFKKFAKTQAKIANDISFDIYEGEVFTLLGESGSGKTTLLRMIAGLESPDSATIVIDNKVVFDKKTNLRANEREISIVFQNYALLPHLNIKNNITFGSSYNKEWLDEVVKKTKIEAILDKYPHQISGGQQQRVALVRAILNKPKILLLDEPLSNIDNQLRITLRSELKEMIKLFGITTVFITHDKEDAFFLSNKIAILHDGEILQVGTPKELYTHPKTEYCATFLGKVNHFSREFFKKLSIDESELYARFEAVNISNSYMHKALVKDVIFYGSCYEIELYYKGHSFFAITLSEDININDEVGFDIDLQKCFSFK